MVRGRIPPDRVQTNLFHPVPVQQALGLAVEPPRPPDTHALEERAITHLRETDESLRDVLKDLSQRD